MNELTDVEKEQVLISHPATCFGIAVPQQILDHFGGMGHTVKVEHETYEDGSVWIAMSRGKRAKAKRGELSLRKNDGTHPARVMWRGKYAPPPPARHKFGPTFVPWRWENKEKTRFTCVLPKPSKLSKPQTKTHHEPKQGTLALEHRKPAPESDTGGQVAALAQAFSTIGEILGKPGPEIKRLLSGK